MDNLPQDTKPLLFSKEKKVAASLPAESWLIFMKKHVLKARPKEFNFGCLIFLIPLTAFIFLLATNNSDNDFIMGIFIVSIFASMIAFAIISSYKKHAFVHVPAFHHLARFIIHIKGDLYHNLFNLRLNMGVIETDENALEPNVLGLKDTSTTKYIPSQLERYYGSFRLKDGSYGVVSLLQICVRVRTKKRRSSGKVKTKVKFKHKLFYQLSLKIPVSLYNVMDSEKLKKLGTTYDVSIKEENKYYLVKIKFKEKLPAVVLKMDDAAQDGVSYFVKMMDFLYSKKIISPTAQNKISK